MKQTCLLSASSESPPAGALYDVNTAVSVAMPTADGLKAEANAAYAEEKFADAVKLYTQ